MQPAFSFFFFFFFFFFSFFFFFFFFFVSHLVHASKYGRGPSSE